jgi:hypothetical protein
MLSLVSTLAFLQLITVITVRAMTVAAADKVYLVTGSESVLACSKCCVLLEQRTQHSLFVIPVSS